MTDTTDAGRILTRRRFVLGLAFASAAGLAYARQPRERIDHLGDGQLESLVPKTIGQWEFLASSGLVIPPEDQLTRATYSQLLTRVYVAEDALPMMLLVAQSATQTGILQVHRPEFCYTAGGFEISETTLQPIRLPGGSILPASTLIADGEGRTEQIVYWTRIGNTVPTSWTQQKIAVAEANLRGFVPDAALIRVSTYSKDRPAALAQMEKFIQQLYRQVPPRMQKVLTA